MKPSSTMGARRGKLWLVRAFRQLPLRRQVVLAIGLACGLALLVSSIAMSLSAWGQFRGTFERDLTALARILADQVQAPLAFNDPKGATELLAALQSKPQVLSAIVQTPSREMFARYGAAMSATQLARFPQFRGLRYEAGQAYLAEPIVLEGTQLGRLLVRADYRGEWRRLFLTQVAVMSLVLVGALGLASVAAFQLQRLVTSPILRLTQAARRIAAQRDYSVRVEQEGQAEVAVLTEAFNQMLEQIQARDVALQQARDQLEQRVAERTRELAESVSVLQATLESTADGILVVDTQQRVTQFNQRFAQMWRIPEDLLQTRDDRRLVAHMLDQLADPDEFVRTVNDLYARPEAEQHDLIRFKDGRVFERFTTPQRVGEVCVGRVWSFRDITQRVQTQQELERERDRARQYFEIAAVLMLVLDADGRVVKVNARGAQILGWEAHELMGCDWFETCVPPEQQAAVRQVFDRLMAGELEGTEHYENEVLTKAGQRRLVRFHNALIRDKAGNIIGTLSSGEDVTQQRRIEQQLRQLSRAVEQSPASIVITDPQGRIEYVNPRFTEVTGYSLEEVRGQNPRILKSGETPPEEYARLWRTITAGGEWRGEFHNRKKNGELFWESAVICPIKDETGRITHFLGVKEDITARKAAEQALRDNEAKLAAITRSAQDGIIMMDSAGRVSFWNEAAEQIFGYTADEALGQELHRLVAPERFHPAYYRGFAVFQRTGQGPAVGRTLELVARRKDGQEFPVELSLSAVQLQGAWHAVGVVRDITARKAAEQQVQDALNFSHTLLQASPIGIMAFRASGQVVAANEAMADLLGCTLGHLQGSNLQELSGWTVARLQSAAEAALASGSTIRQEVTLTDRSGHVRWLACRFVPFQFQGQAHVLGLFVDVTEQKQAEAALRQSEALFRLISENAAELISIVDRQGIRRYCSPSYKTVLGFEPEALCGTEWHVGVHPEDVDRLRQATEEAFRTGICRTLEYRRQHKDGSWRVLESTGALIDQGPTGQCLLLVARDVTERKRAEAERAAMQLQLQQAQKLEAIGRLAAGIAHEINTPTQFIGDNLKFLKDTFNDLVPVLDVLDQVRQADRGGGDLAALVEPVRDLAAKVDVDYLRAEIPSAIAQSQEGVQRVTRIVQAMKEFSHPGSTEKTPADLNRALETTLTICRNEWKYVAEVVTDFEPDPPLVPCLTAELNQVFLNLVVNAAQAIAEKVGDRRDAKGTITVRTRRQGDWFEIQIADTGPGIPEHVRPRIFEPFFTTKPVGKGTGQGLALARSIVVDKHGGTISFDTQVGQGTTFTIRLPLQPTQAAAPAKKAA